MTQWVGFFNDTAQLVIFFTVIFLFADLFEAFRFPFNLPYPLFNAYGSVLIISFIFRIISFAATKGSGLYYQMTDIMIIIAGIVAIITLISGYAKIFLRESYLHKYGDDEDEEFLWRERREGWRRDSRKRKTNRRDSNKSAPEWDEVGDEFRGMLYDTFRSVREKVKKKK